MSEPSIAQPVAPAVSGSRTVLRQSVVITAAALGGKALALVRDAAVGRAFGAGAATDALFLALSLPVTLSSIVAGGGVRIAFQPELARRVKSGDARGASRYGTLVLLATAALSVPLALFLTFEAERVAHFLGGADAPAGLAHMLRLLAPMLPLLVLLDVVTGLLHARLHFLWPALEAPIRNAAIAGCALVFAAVGVDAVAWGHLGGTVVVVAACAIAAWTGGFRLVAPVRGDGAALGSLARAAVPAILGSSAYPLSVLVDRAMAASLPTGSVAALSFADGLWQAGLFVAGPVATVAFPVLSALAASGDTAEFATTARRTTRASILVTAPPAALLAALALPVVTVVLRRGRFDLTAAELTASVAAAFALGLPFVAAQAVLTRALQARGDLTGPARLSMLSLLVHAGLNLPFMALFGVAGIALSSSVSSALLVVLLVRRLGLPAPGRARFAASLTLATVACAAAAFGSARLVPALDPPLVDGLVRAAVGSAAGLAAFAAAAAATRLDEWGAAVRMVTKRVISRG